MGMAASQARFLGLTARKSNNEYQVQQINQQRLDLANQQAEITKNYNDKLSNRMFLFNDGDDETTDKQLTYWNIVNGIDNEESPGIGFRIVDKNGNEVVPNYRGIPEGNTEIQAIIDKYNVTDDAKDNTKLYSNIIDGTWTMRAKRTDDEGSEYWFEIPYEEASFISKMRTENPEDDTDTEYWRLFNTLTDKINGEYQELSFENLTTMKDLEIRLYDADDKIVVPELPEADYETVYGKYCVDPYCIDPKYMEEKLRNGDWFIQQPDRPSSNGWSDNKALSTCAYIEDVYDTSDDAAAEAEYEYLIAKVQKQDKLLEMQLKQLETEHNAIQTEMDAVSQVLTKNVETTFKTFSA